MPAMIIVGLIILSAGIGLELMILLRSAWPSLLSWIMMGAGLVILGIGVLRNNPDFGKFILVSAGSLFMVTLILWITS